MVFVYMVAWIAKSLSHPGSSDDFQLSVHLAIKFARVVGFIDESRRQISYLIFDNPQLQVIHGTTSP